MPLRFSSGGFGARADVDSEGWGASVFKFGHRPPALQLG
jgi:hypothetical protein